MLRVNSVCNFLRSACRPSVYGAGISAFICFSWRWFFFCLLQKFNIALCRFILSSDIVYKMSFDIGCFKFQFDGIHGCQRK